MPDPRLLQLHEMMAAVGDPDDAAQQKRYHKSRFKFHGLKADTQRGILKEVFPGRAFSRAEFEPFICELWQSEWSDERVAALSLLEKLVKQLVPGDLPWLYEMTRSCEGWAELDTLACRLLGPMAVTHGGMVYEPVRIWADDGYMWTRRAAILIHIIPARKGKLAHDYAWPTFEERLHEKEFFIRKAIGWTLREISKRYAKEVHGFLVRVGDSASALTRREGARNLPDELRIPILGK